MVRNLYFLAAILAWSGRVFASGQILDDFSPSSGWQIIASDQVRIDTSRVPGYSGTAMRLDFEFLAGSGYGGVRKQIPLKLPENYQFSFYLKGDAPSNNFEFKLSDASGDNVWWLNQRNFDFPRAWQKITIKKRHIEFAWGPTQDRNLRSSASIEFIIASATGGKGSIYLDELKFEPLAIPDTSRLQPRFWASSTAAKNQPIETIFDGNLSTGWRSKSRPERQEIRIDLQKQREFGGLMLYWDALDFPRQYQVLSSNDGRQWEVAYSVIHGKGGRSYIALKDYTAQFLKLALQVSSRKNGYGLNELAIPGIDFSATPEAFFTAIAADHLRGHFPRYFYREQSYWTLTGVNNDSKEALINEDGLVEIDKNSPSIEPFVFLDGQLVTWNDVQCRQGLEQSYVPIPSVTWQHPSFELQTEIFADGAVDSSFLYASYRIKNTTPRPLRLNLFLAIRPFQVNPPWQFLNWPGGTTKIKSLRYQDDQIWINEAKNVISITKPAGFGAAGFDQGDITEFIRLNHLPQSDQVEDHFGYASGAFKYELVLAPKLSQSVYLVIPFHQTRPDLPEFASAAEIDAFVQQKRLAVSQFWQNKVGQIEFDLPHSADKLIHSLRANLAYILLNRDGPGIQPGSRSYERSWIRDGSMTATALLKMGIVPEVRDFYDWYSRYQYDSGKVPCVVDRRGPDPVPEHDSHGQLIYGLLQYFIFSGDTAFLRQKFVNVQKAVGYMEELIRQRSTDFYKNGPDSARAFYGLVPESISHEGYSAKPMHSYWDDFFVLKGLKDAVTIAGILGETDWQRHFTAVRDTFHHNLYQSIRLAIQNHQIDYIPGCVELGDFDATSTAIAIHPVNELHNLPQPYADNTFARYFDFFQNRRQPGSQWLNYTPYEVRLITAFIYLNQVDRAWQLLDFFFTDQRPPDWNHWAEVVWSDFHAPQFIGDMPHTWVGSDFIHAARALFVYEDELDQSLRLGAGLRPDWLEAANGMAVKNLPTYYGTLNYSVRKIQSDYRLELSGDLRLPAGKIKIKNFAGVQPRAVFVNGKKITTFDAQDIVVAQFPATVEIQY